MTSDFCIHKNKHSMPKLRFTLMAAAQLMGTLLLQATPADARGREVTATVYHGWFHGRTTYCDTTYQHWGISAAHPWLPCGTQVRVSHQGRTLTVPITDRCSCNAIDLSAGAAAYLGVPLDGIARVRITP